jgi:hypothetical protein
MGPLRLGRLAVGQARPLRSDERRNLLAHVAKLRVGEKATKSKPRRAAGTATGGRSKPRVAQRTTSSRKGVRK